MFEKILVPTDASEYSRRGLETAIALAQKFNAKLVLLHVTHTPEAYLGYTVTYGISVSHSELERIGQLALEATLTGMAHDSVPLTTKLESGYPASVILRQITEEDIDLVVMGSHGHGALIGSMLGSVSQRVLAHAACPVLIVK
ncbi:MAG: universal stress protein [Peptococcaceae bacterium]|nr:universal stress protein [Peptococcaceae bacterium]